MLHQLQTSSVAVVKDCFHAVDVACAEDFFEDPKWAVARFFNGRAVVRSLPPSACPRQTFLYYMNIVNISFISRQYAACQGMACVCVCAGVYSKQGHLLYSVWEGSGAASIYCNMLS